MKRWIAAAALLPLCFGAAHALVNVNTAQQSELQRTKGLDRYKAKSIIEYRAQNGAFQKIDDLERVPGFDKDTVGRIAPQVAVSGPAFTPTKVEPKAEPKSKKK